MVFLSSYRMIRGKNLKTVWQVVQNEETGQLELDKQIAASFYTVTGTSHFGWYWYK